MPQSIIQLSPPLWVYTPLGEGWALFLIDYGMNHNTCWVVALNKTRRMKHFDSNDIRLAENQTYGFPKPDLNWGQNDDTLSKHEK